MLWHFIDQHMLPLLLQLFILSKGNNHSVCCVRTCVCVCVCGGGGGEGEGA